MALHACGRQGAVRTLRTGTRCAGNCDGVYGSNTGADSPQTVQRAWMMPRGHTARGADARRRAVECDELRAERDRNVAKCLKPASFGRWLRPCGLRSSLRYAARRPCRLHTAAAPAPRAHTRASATAVADPRGVWPHSLAPRLVEPPRQPVPAVALTASSASASLRHAPAVAVRSAPRSRRSAGATARRRPAVAGRLRRLCCARPRRRCAPALGLRPITKASGLLWPHFRISRTATLSARRSARALLRRSALLRYARLVGRSSSALSPPFRRCTALRRRP